MTLPGRKRREGLLIIGEVLNVATEGVLKTQIMYRANLSFAQLNDYLALLLDLNFLEPIKTSRRTLYKTTDKGQEYLQSYRKIRKLLKKPSDKRQYSSTEAQEVIMRE